MSGMLHGLIASSVFANRVTRVSGFTGSTLSNGITAITCTGLTAGDLIVACGGAAESSTDPTVSSGWTKIASVGDSNRRLVVVYRIASSASDSVTFTGTTSDIAGGVPYSSASVFRGATAIGAYNGVNLGGGSGTSIPSPSLTLSSPPSALFLATYAAVITSAPNGMTVSNGHAYIESSYSWSGGNFTTSSSLKQQSVIVEIY